MRWPSRNLQYLLFAVFLDLFGAMLVVPILPSIWKEISADNALRDKVSSVYALAQIVGPLLLGGISDQYGRRVGLLLSMAGAGLSYGLMGVAFSVHMYIASRVIVGLAKQTMDLSTALAADMAPDAKSEALFQVSAAEVVGASLGRFVGGRLSDSLGLRLPMALSVAIFIFDFFWVRFMLPEGKVVAPAANAAHTGGIQSAKMLFKNSAIASVVVVRLLYDLVWATMSGPGDAYLQERFSLTPGRLGELGFLMGMLQFAMMFAGGGALARSLGQVRAVVLMLLVQAVAFFIEANDIGIGFYVLLPMPLKAITHSVISPCLLSLFLDVVPEDQRGTAFAGYSVLRNVAKVMAPLLTTQASTYLDLISWNWVGVFGALGLAYLVSFVLGYKPAQPAVASTQVESEADRRVRRGKSGLAVALAVTFATWHHYHLHCSHCWCGLAFDPCTVGSVVEVEGFKGIVLHDLRPDRHEAMVHWVTDSGDYCNHAFVPLPEACRNEGSVALGATRGGGRPEL